MKHRSGATAWITAACVLVIALPAPRAAAIPAFPEEYLNSLIPTLGAALKGNK